MNKNQRLKILEEKIIPGEWLPESKYLQKLLAELACRPLTPERFSLAAVHKIMKGKT